MDPLTHHHYYNIANGFGVEDPDTGNLQTVRSIIVNIDGKETLIPTVWDGEIVSDQKAIDNAIATGLEWPTDEPNPEGRARLQALDAEIHEEFTDETTPEAAFALLEASAYTSQFNQEDEDDGITLYETFAPLGKAVLAGGQLLGKKMGFALGGLAESRKGITTEAGLEMANKRFQRDDKKADLNGDGKLNSYEKARGDAVQKAVAKDEIPEMSCGGLMVDPISGNEIPIGSNAKNVRDDIDIKISEGEYVLPANVVKWLGLKGIMDLQAEAEMGLMTMEMNGLIQYTDDEGEEAEICPECDGEGCDHCDGKGYHDVEEEESDSESSEDTEVQAESDPKQEEKDVIETPQGNEIEVVGYDIEERNMATDMPEEDDEDYYPTQSRELTMMKSKPLKFII